MAKPSFNLDHKIALDALLLKIPGVVGGKMFGYPAYYIDRKLFACVYGDGVGIKVPEAFAQGLLAYPHVTAFQPMGKPQMREWVQINRDSSSDYELDKEAFRCAAEFARAAKKK